MINIVFKIISLVAIICLSPIILFASLFVYLEDGLPVFFIQKRLGKDEVTFNMIKIRTMCIDTPSLGTHQIKDANFLHTGKVLRRLKIDELPQLLNFIKGDLNLVGPRPGLPNQKKLLMHRRLLNIFNQKPGITGLGQILGFDMSNPEILAKIDNLYVTNRTLKLDIKILFATFIKGYRLNIYNEFKEKIEIIKENSGV